MKKQNPVLKEDKEGLVEKPGKQGADTISPTTEEKVIKEPQAPTSTKRKLVISPDKYSMFKIGYEGGGEQPKEFKGNLYTSHAQAKKALENYLAKKQHG